MQDTWSKVDESIYASRWFILVALISMSLIGGGYTLLTRKPALIQSHNKIDTATINQLVAGAQAGEEETVTGPININTATQAELESLPGIGPAIAERIIEYRKSHGLFKKKEDIQNVKGIGPKTFASLKDKIITK